MRGLKQNQINTPNYIYIYQNDEHKKIYTFGDFERETPTHKGGAHAISKFSGNFEIRIPRELDRNIDMPRISMIY